MCEPGGREPTGRRDRSLAGWRHRARADDGCDGGGGASDGAARGRAARGGARAEELEVATARMHRAPARADAPPPPAPFNPPSQQSEADVDGEAIRARVNVVQGEDATQVEGE